MKTKHKIIVLALAMGFLTWVFDAYVDYLFFYKATFMDSLITKVSGHETYMRLVVVFSLLIFGVVISVFYTRLDEQGEELKRALTGSHKHQAETAALLEASRAVMEHQTFAAAARTIFDHCREIIGAPGGYISLTDKTGTQNEVVFLEAGGLPCTVDPDLPMPIRGLRAEAYEEGRAIYDNNFSQSDYTAFLPDGHVAMDNVLFAPLLYQGKAVGLLGLANKPGGFTDHDASLAAGFAELAAIALLNKRAEEDRERLIRELEAEKSFLNSVVEQMPAGVAIVEAPSGKLILGNSRLQNIWGLSELPVDVHHCFSEVRVLHADKRPYRLEEWPLQRSLAAGEVVLGEEVTLIREDHSQATIMVSSAPIRDGQGNVVAGVSTCVDVTERKAAEEILRLREAHLRHTFDQSPIGAAIVSLDYRYVRVNAEFCRLVGYSEKELQDLSFAEITHPEDVAVDLGEVSRLLAGEIDHFSLEKRYIHKDGQVVWARLAVGLVTDAAGAPLHFLAMVEDITARKQAETELRESREMFRQLAENIRDVFFIRCAGTGKLHYVSPAYEHIWGSSTESLYENPLSFLEAIYPEDRDSVTAAYEKHSRGLISHQEHRIVRADGEIGWIWVRAFPIRNEKGEVYRVAGIAEDITERKAAEEALQRAHDELEQRVQERTAELRQTVEQLQAEIAERERTEGKLKESEARFRTLLQTAGNCIFTLTPNGRIIEFNQEAERVTGWQRHEVAGQDVFYLFIAEANRDQAKAELAKIIRGEITRNFEFPFKLKDGTERIFLWNANVVNGSGDHPMEVIAVGQDITERKRAEEALEAERQRFFSLLEELPAYICLAAPDKSLKFVNRCFREVFGEPEGRYCFEIMHGCGELCDECPTLSVLETNRSLEWEWTRDDGITFQIYDYPFADIDGSPLVLEMGIDITARKQAEEALATERQRLFNLFNQLPAFVYLIAPDYSIPFANSRFREVFGDHEGQNCHNLIRGLDGPCPECPAITTFQTGKSTEYELNLPDGRVYQMFAYPFGDADGSPLVLKMGIDITDRKQAEEALWEKSRILEAFFDHTITPLVFFDRQLKFIRVNEAYARACLRQVEDFPSKSYFELFPDEEREALFLSVVKTQVPYQALAQPFTFPDHPEWGVTYWDWTLVPVLDDHGAVDFLVFSLTDVTQRVLAEEKKAQLHEILEATPDLVGTADTYGRVFYINQAGRQMLGLGPDEDLARATIADFHPPDASELIYTQAIPTSRQEGVWQGETKLRSRDGREIPISQVILAHRTPEGKVKFFSTIARDISDLKKAEASLRMLTSQLLKAQEVERRRLSRELHDELGQSLLVLKLQTKSIERKLPPGQEALREDCSRALKYIDEIINNVRRLSRDLSPSILEDLGLSAALNYLLDEFRRHHETLNFLVELEPLDQYISKESQMNIFRIFQESLTNIAKYAQASQIKMVFKKEGDMLLGVVEDDGKGFEVGEILTKDGYDKGLGLAAMEERIRIMGGSLVISSEKGGGTKVAFHVPLGKDA